MGRKHINAAPPRNCPTVRVCAAEHPSGIGFCTRLPGHGDDRHRALIAGRWTDWSTKTTIPEPDNVHIRKHDIETRMPRRTGAIALRSPT